MQKILIVSLALASVTACSRHRAARPTPVSTATVGQCVDPSRAGVTSKRPSPRHADRDLDGDGEPEIVIADDSLCTDQGNCYWNVFRRDRAANCHRYAGTIAAQVIDRLPRRGDGGFHHLRGWWRLAGDERVLLQEYQYRHDGYRIAEAMICRQQGDDRLECAPDGH